MTQGNILLKHLVKQIFYYEQYQLLIIYYLLDVDDIHWFQLFNQIRINTCQNALSYESH